MRAATIVLLLLVVAGCGGESGGRALSDADTGSSGEQEALCRAGDRVVTTVSVDAPSDVVYGVHTRLYYPVSLDLPGRRDKRSVVERVAFVVAMPNGSAGLPEEAYVRGATIVFDEDSDADGVDDRVNALLSSPFESFPEGKFVDVTFDCVETIPWPTAADLRCEVAGMSSEEFVEVMHQSTCDVTVSPPPAR